MSKVKEINKIDRYKRRLPHWRMSGSVYFVTWRLSKTTAARPTEGTSP
jgi:hypothetical protein